MVSRDDILAFLREKAYRPLTATDLAVEFGVAENEDDRQAFMGLLDDLEKEGLAVQTRSKRYGVPEKMNLVVGKLQGHHKGFAFLLPQWPEVEDVYISSSNINTAMHGDRVIVRLLAKKGKGRRGGDSLEGEVIRILDRANQRIVGTFDRGRHYGFITPEDRRLTQDVFIPKEAFNGAKTGDVVVSEIINWPEGRRNPEGTIIRSLGRMDDPGVDIDLIVETYRLPGAFSQGAVDQAEGYSQEQIQGAARGRWDLRDLLTITIDGEDAKDFDDAVTMEPLGAGKGWRLGVHIADVGFYVPVGSPLDQDAFQRGTSVYLVDRVIPMLPEALSNDLCSLRPGVDRLSFSAFITFNGEGERTGFELGRSIIRSDSRMTYKQVSAILEKGDTRVRQQYHQVVPMLEDMAQLSGALTDMRLQRGALDFDFPESKVILDEKGLPLEILRRDRNLAHRIIEEFMLACNEAIANYAAQHQLPFAYRVHEEPSADDIDSFNEFAGPLGLQLPASGKVAPRHMQRILEKVRGTEKEMIVSTVMLRSLQRARYHPRNLGHFGLAAEYYCHFTSPIRRYPDLLIHRILAEHIEKGTVSQAVSLLPDNLQGVAETASEYERRAEAAERESVDLKKVEYMERHVGDDFDGVISGVIEAGFFVQLDNMIEGMVHVSNLTDDYYVFDPVMRGLRGRRTRKAYALGDKVQVKVIKAAKAKRQIDFMVVD